MEKERTANIRNLGKNNVRIMYNYKAIVTKIYDGDTITLDIDLGFGIWKKKQSIRLARIDAAEIRGEERPQGLIVRDTLREWIPLGTEIHLETVKDRTGKYGRYIGEIYPIGESLSYNQRLLNENLVEPYEE